MYVYVIREEEILPSLLGFEAMTQDFNAIVKAINITNNYEEVHKVVCPIDITSLAHYNVSLTPDPNIYDSSLKQVQSGGRWKPQYCLSQFKGNGALNTFIPLLQILLYVM